MEDFLKNRFSELVQIKEDISYITFKGFDKLYQKKVILKLILPISTVNIELLSQLAYLHHENLISPLDLVPLPEGYYCVVFPEYPQISLTKNDFKEGGQSFALQIRAVIEFLYSKNIPIKNISLGNFKKDNGTIYLSEFEENCSKNFLMNNHEDIERTLSRFAGIGKIESFKKIKNEFPHLIPSFLGFDLRRKEDQVIDGFLEEKGGSSTKVLGIFGREGQGKSVFLKNFIIRNRSLSSPVIFINSTEKEEVFNSFYRQLSWIGLNTNHCIDSLVETIERAFSENRFTSLIFIFDDLDRADYEVIEFFEKLGYLINESIPIKVIFTSKTYFPFLKDLKSFHLNLSFLNFKEFRDRVWIGYDEMEDSLEIAWKKSGGNLHFFHWIIKDPEFWKKGIAYKHKDYIKKELLRNYSEKEIEILNFISCFPKGFDIGWFKILSSFESKDILSLRNRDILEEKGTRLFLKEPWLTIIHENISEDEKVKIHELGANIDRENSYYHFFMAKKFESGVEELERFLLNLKEKGQIKEAINLAKNFEEYVDKIDSNGLKFNFYKLFSELLLKTGDFENAFHYIAKSSQFVRPSSKEWMDLKVKIAECLHGMMKYGKAINVLKGSIKFAELYNYREYVNAFKYQLSKNLWKIGKLEESEEILKNLEIEGSNFYSGISKRDRGYYTFLRGEASVGKELIESSLKLLKDFPLEEAISLKYLSCIFMKEKRWEEAYRYFSRAMRIFQKENDLFNLAGLCSDIGKLFLEKEDLLNAEKWFRKALEIYSRIENPRGITLSKFNLTEIMIPFGQWDEAKKILRQCAEIDMEAQNLLSYAYDINSMGYVEFLKGNFKEAMELLEESEKIFRDFNAVKELLDTKLKLLEIFFETGDIYRSKGMIDEIENMSLSEEFAKELLSYKLLKSKFLLKREENKKAEKLLSEVIEKAIQNEFKTILGGAFFLKALSLKNKDKCESKNCFLKSIDTFDETHNIFLKNISLLEYYREFPDAIEIPKAREALDWLRDCGYYKYSFYEDSIFPKEQEGLSQKILKFLSDLGKFDWIRIYTFESGVISLKESYPPSNTKHESLIDVSFLAPVVFKAEDVEILQVPIIKLGVLEGLVHCGKKGAIEEKDIELILTFIEPIYSIFCKKKSKEEDKKGEEPRIIGGKSIAKIMEIINKIKDFNYPVLIIGESGTGKELIARYIHNLSSRRKGPFVPINCSALPEHLLESELFGWVKGAFTGANTERKGLIEEADGGTFFLDEIGDLPLPLQAKLLRVLQEKETRRLGENKIRKIDVRFISATNKDLEKEIKERKFREDLYYRIKGVVIHIPPLRERKDDIPLLSGYFIEKYCNEMGKEKVYLSQKALEALLSYSWPGNVRELESELRNTIMLLDPGKKVIDIEDLPPHIASQRVIRLDVGEEYDLSTAKEIFEKNYIEEVLRRNNWNRKKSAEALKITRQGLFKLMKKYGIKENG